MEYTGLMILVASDGHTPIASLCKETYVACVVDTVSNKLKVILHHQINVNPRDYGDHVYTVDLNLNRRQYEAFRNWIPCPLHEYANLAHILVER